MSALGGVKPRRGIAPSAAELPDSSAARYSGALAEREQPPYDARVSLVQAVTGVSEDQPGEVLARVRAGLPSRVINVLEAAYGATQAEMARSLLIPASTLRRRLRQDERLEVDESDRVVRLARIKDLVLALMGGDDQAAIAWLHAPREVLGNESPLTRASTEIGAREVEDLIGRLRHGVFS